MEGTKIIDRHTDFFVKLLATKLHQVMTIFKGKKEARQMLHKSTSKTVPVSFYDGWCSETK